MYSYLLKPLFFLLPPERAHALALRLLSIVAYLPFGKALLKRLYCIEHPALATNIAGVTFPNPFGLAAGFDKDGKYVALMACLGFGFVELGTITPKPQSGNPKPRLFRLPKDKALINRMGFNNEGVDALCRRLSRLKKKPIIIGGNIGKNKDTPNEHAADDYLYCFAQLFPFVDYFVVNVSSPNTPGLRALQEREPLTTLLLSLQAANQAQPNPKPLFLKIAPDLSPEQIREIVNIVQQTGISGIVATNTTLDREALKTPAERLDHIGMGGLSGKPLRNRSRAVTDFILQEAGGSIPLISVGGIADTEEATLRLQQGAAAVQVYTAFIYEGPGLAKRVLKAWLQQKG